MDAVRADARFALGRGPGLRTDEPVGDEVVVERPDDELERATEDIAAQIAGIQAATEAAVRSIGQITSSVGAMDGVASTIAAAVEEQNAATGEITRSASHAAEGTSEVQRMLIARGLGLPVE